MSSSMVTLCQQRHMSKSYDIIEFGYAKALMKSMGFPSKLKARVIMCVSSISFLALNNDKPYERILPKEGLRQRDPFFPFLFVLCTEGHINQLAKGLKVRKLQGIQFSDTCPMVNS